MSILEEIIYIRPQRKTIPTYLARYEGQLYDAPFNWWSKQTGLTVACMCARRKQVREGNRDYTNEQIIGIDSINFDRTQNLPSVKKKSLRQIHSEKIDPMSLFLRGKIGWDRKAI